MNATEMCTRQQLAINTYSNSIPTSMLLIYFLVASYSRGPVDPFQGKQEASDWLIVATQYGWNQTCVYLQ